jgi:hypothetical protein
MKTKEEVVREELQFGKEADMLPELIRVLRRPGMNVDRLTAIADGADVTAADVDALFVALNLDEDSLEDEDDE